MLPGLGLELRLGAMGPGDAPAARSEELRKAFPLKVHESSSPGRAAFYRPGTVPAALQASFFYPTVTLRSVLYT